MLHSNQCWGVLTKFWVKYGQTQMLNVKIVSQLQLSLQLYILITFLTQHLGLSIFDPNLG